MTTLALDFSNQQKKAFQFLTVAMAALFIFTSSAFAETADVWQNQNLKVKGQWSIEQKNGETFLTLNDEFKTRGAPDLKLFLSKSNFQNITGDNATNDAVLISPLKSKKGAQTYKIPSNISIDEYQSLILHCEQYSKLWASTPLK